MPETKEKALKRASEHGFEPSSVTKAKDDGYFIAPHGIKSEKAKKTYADIRSKGKDKETAAKIAWSIEKENDLIEGGKADNKSLRDIADKHNVTLSVIEKALAEGIDVEMEHTDDAKVAEEVAKDHLFEMADYYSKLAKVEKQNSKDYAQVYRATNFIEKGVCTYNDETIYLSQGTLERAMRSMKGRPVVIKHQKVTPENMQDHAVGYVTDSGQFDSFDAGFTCPFIVFDDEGKEVIAKDYSVSCAYLPKAFGKGGTWHNTPYDREVTELEFTHLALVPDPRYEDAKIYENSKNDDTTTKETYNMENEKVEVPVALLDKILGFIQQPFLNAKEVEKEEPKEKDEDEMEYEGKKYSKKELVNAFESSCAGKKKEEEKEMKNEKEAEEEVVEAEKENSKDDDMQFFNSMQSKLNQASQTENTQVWSEKQGAKEGYEQFRIRN